MFLTVNAGERDYHVDGSYDSASDSEESFSNVLHDPWISRSADNNISLRRKEISQERKQKWIFSSSQKNHFDRLTTICGEKLGLDVTIHILGKLG